MSETIINGVDGKLEARYHHNTTNPAPPVAMVLHPHPLHGGTMNNKIIYYMFHILKQKGFSVLRFNFRGTGKSEGTFGDGIGEVTDATVALDWLMKNNPESRVVWVLGFSFGSWVATQIVMRRPEVITFALVAPPVNLYDFNFLAPCPASGIIIQGGQDTIVDITQVDEFQNRCNAYPDIAVEYGFIEEADHFFKNKLEEFKEVFSNYVDDKIQKDTEQFANFKVYRRRRKSRKTMNSSEQEENK